MEWVATVLDANVQQRQSHDGHVSRLVVDELDNGLGGISGAVSLFRVDVIRHLKVQS